MDISKKEKKKIERLFNEKIKKIEEKDIKKAIIEGEKKIKLLEYSKLPHPIKDFWDTLKVLINLLKDYKSGEYRKISRKSMAIIIFAIIYFISPFDSIPDFIPFTGYLDDVFVIKTALNSISDELAYYKKWKDKTKKDS